MLLYVNVSNFEPVKKDLGIWLMHYQMVPNVDMKKQKVEYKSMRNFKRM